MGIAAAFAGGQVIGVDDGRPGQQAGPILATGQQFVQLAADIPHVRSPSLHIFVVHGFQHGRKLGRGFPGGCFGSQMVLDHQGFAGIVQVRILEHQLVHFKNGGFFFPGFHPQLFQIGQNLLPGGLKPGHFLLRRQGADRRSGALGLGGFYQQRTYGNTFRSAFSLD